MGRLIFHCSNVFVSSCFHPLFVRIIDAAPYLGIRACACPVACRSSFTPEPRHPSINQTDGYVFFSFPSPRTGHVCLILAVSPDRTISAPLPKGVGKTIARPLPIMLAVQRFVSNNRKAVGVRNRLDRIGLPKRKCLAVIMKSIQVSCFR